MRTPPPLRAGGLVTIFGLSNRVDLNGQQGKLLRAGSAASVLNFINLGSSLSIRKFIRIGSGTRKSRIKEGGRT